MEYVLILTELFIFLEFSIYGDANKQFAVLL